MRWQAVVSLPVVVARATRLAAHIQDFAVAPSVGMRPHPSTMVVMLAATVVTSPARRMLGARHTGTAGVATVLAGTVRIGAVDIGTVAFGPAATTGGATRGSWPRSRGYTRLTGGAEIPTTTQTTSTTR